MADKICVCVIDADGNEFFYKVDSDSDPSRLMAEEMGNGRIRVNFKTVSSDVGCASVETQLR